MSPADAVLFEFSAIVRACVRRIRRLEGVKAEVTNLRRCFFPRRCLRLHVDRDAVNGVLGVTTLAVPPKGKLMK